MSTQTFNLQNPAPQITIQGAQGDLTISGWIKPEIMIRSDEDVQVLDQNEDGITIELQDDATIQAPINSVLRIGTLHGDVSIVAIAGSISLDKAKGDAELRDVGPLHIEGVDGDLAVRGVRGDCRIGGVGGEASLSVIYGSLNMHGVGGDLVVADVLGNVQSTAGGDVTLRLIVSPGNRYAIAAGGDVNVRIQEDAGLTVKLTSGGDISVRNLEAPSKSFNHAASFTIGTGDASLKVDAGGDIMLRGMRPEEMGDPFADFGVDMSFRAADLAQQVVSQIESRVGSVARQLDEKLSSLGANEEFSARIQEKIQSSLRRAEEHLSEVLRKAERHTAEAEKRAQEAHKRGARGVVWPPTPPPAPRAPKPTRQASDEERGMVLRMVSEGKISVEQAEKLLSILNSGDD